MSAFDKHGKLVEGLLAKSDTSGLEWRATPTDSAFQVSFANSSVRIKEKTTSAGAAGLYTIELINEDGQVADSFTDEELDRFFEGKIGAKYFRAMHTLFERARRAALGSDKVLDNILRQLGQ
jgi:hypothetical protein